MLTQKTQKTARLLEKKNADAHWCTMVLMALNPNHPVFHRNFQRPWWVAGYDARVSKGMGQRR